MTKKRYWLTIKQLEALVVKPHTLDEHEEIDLKLVLADIKEYEKRYYLNGTFRDEVYLK